MSSNHNKFVYIFLFIFLFINICTSGTSLFEKYGLKIGTSLATQKWEYHDLPPYFGDPNLPTKIRWGIDAAVYLQVADFKILSIITEIHYIQKGRCVTISGITIADNPDGYEETGPHQITMSFNYLSLPILLRTNLLQSSYSPYLFLGPRLDYLIYHEPSSVYDNFTKIDYGMTIGLGCEMNFEFVIFLVEIRYSPTLNYSYQNQYLNVKNECAEILIGIQL